MTLMRKKGQFIWKRDKVGTRSVICGHDLRYEETHSHSSTAHRVAYIQRWERGAVVMLNVTDRDVDLIKSKGKHVGTHSDKDLEL